MTVYSGLKGKAFSLVIATTFLVLSPAGASPSNKPSSLEPALSSPAYGTSAAEQRDEQVISECDQKADQAKVSEAQRMDYIRRCLADLANHQG